MADTYTHKDLAGICGVSETTIKSYRRKFPGFIPILTRGKPIRFKPEAAEVCLRIRDCFDKGMSVGETRKVLKEHFKEHPTQAARSGRADASSSPCADPVVSPEYLEKFFETAGQMMQGMAALATAQAKASQRLEKLETTLDKLLEIEARNGETFNQLLSQGRVPVAEAAPAAEEGDTAQEPRVRARRIVNVKNAEGDVQSYALEKDKDKVKDESPAAEEKDKPALERPSDAFLNTPIVIRGDQGDFLGVPGRLSLSGFIEILIREAEESGASLSSWKRDEEGWSFTMQAPDGDSHQLYFISTTTPRGNLVVLLHRLDVNGRETSPHFLQEFFRQVKDKI